MDVHGSTLIIPCEEWRTPRVVSSQGAFDITHQTYPRCGALGIDSLPAGHSSPVCIVGRI